MSYNKIKSAQLKYLLELTHLMTGGRTYQKENYMTSASYFERIIVYRNNFLMHYNVPMQLLRIPLK